MIHVSYTRTHQHIGTVEVDGVGLVLGDDELLCSEREASLHPVQLLLQFLDDNVLACRSLRTSRRQCAMQG